MHVLVLSQYFSPEPIPKPVELAEGLVARGHRVTVVTGVPNYPSGRLYEGHRLGLIRRETFRGIPVIRTFEYPYHGLRLSGRAVNYLSFAASAPLAAAFVSDVDVIYVWHPPLTVGIPAWALGRLVRAPFVYDVQDIWPDAVVDAGSVPSGMGIQLLRRLEGFVYRRAAHLITATEPARQNLIEKGVVPGNVTALPHWLDLAPWTPMTSHRDAVRHELGWHDRFVVVFAGNLGRLQALDTIVFAARHFRMDERFHIAFVGDGSERARLEQLVRENQLADRVSFLPPRPASEMPRLLAGADAVVVHLARSRITPWTIPSKTLAYLASGVPIVVATEGPTAELVEQAGAGLVTRAEDPEALAHTIRALAALPDAERMAMGARGRAYVATHLSQERVVPQYESLLARVAAAARGHGS
jgi:glycosyltransferase involved in cell wall biosynthesis